MPPLLSQQRPYYYPAVEVPVRYAQYPTPAPPNTPTYIRPNVGAAAAADRIPHRPTTTTTDRAPNRSIFLSNLPYASTPTTIRDALTRYGRIERCDVPLDRRDAGKIRGDGDGGVS